MKIGQVLHLGRPQGEGILLGAVGEFCKGFVERNKSERFAGRLKVIVGGLTKRLAVDLLFFNLGKGL